MCFTLNVCPPPAAFIYWLAYNSCGCAMLFYSFFPFFYFLFFKTGIRCCSPGCLATRTHFVDKAGLQLRDLLASASRELGIKACFKTQLSYCLYSSKFPNQICYLMRRCHYFIIYSIIFVWMMEPTFFIPWVIISNYCNLSFSSLGKLGYLFERLVPVTFW